MRHLLHIIMLTLVAAVISAVTGCSRDNRAIATLDLADSLLSTRPDSALALVTSIDTSALSSPAARARWALSYTIARYKNFIDDNNDSIISTSARYFKEHDDKRHSMLAHFYCAIIRNHAMNYSGSTTAALQALKNAKELSDTFMIGRTYSIMAKNNMETYNTAEAMNYGNLAVEMLSHCPEEREFYLDAYLERAIISSNNQKYEHSLEILDSMQSRLYPNDYIYHGLIARSRMHTFLQLNRVSEAEMCANEFLKYQDYFHNEGETLCLLAEIMLLKHVPDSALIWINRAKKEILDTIDNPFLQSALLKYHIYTNNIKEQNHIYSTMLQSQNKAVDIALRQHVPLAQRDFYIGEASIAAYKSKRAKEIAIFIIMISIIIIVAGFIFFKMRIKMKNLEISNMLVQISTLNTERDTKSDVVNRLLKSHFDILNSLGNEYFNNDDASDLSRKLIYHKVEEEIGKMRSISFLNEVIELVNKSQNNVIEYLRLEFPKFKQDDIKILSLVMAGISVKAISFITDLTVKNIYVKRSRLKERIEKSDAPHRDLILRSLS